MKKLFFMVNPEKTVFTAAEPVVFTELKLRLC